MGLYPNSTKGMVRFIVFRTAPVFFMKKSFTKVLSVFLATILAVSVLFAMPATAVNELDAQDRIQRVTIAEDRYSTEVRDSFSKGFFNILEKALMLIVKSLSLTFATPDTWVDLEDYVPSQFYAGNDTFIDAPAANAKWNLGYANASMLDGMDVIGKYYVAGSIAVGDKFATEVLDDLKVRTIALNDGSGRGTHLFIVCDSYGLSYTEVQNIRAELADFAEENNILSINVSVLHQHSAIDTYGMNGNIFEMVLLNPSRTLFGVEAHNGKNDEFMQNLYKVCKETAIEAVANLEPGTLTFAQADVKEFVRDKRDPMVMDNNFNIFAFNPDNAQSNDTYLIQSPIHCVSYGASTTTVTGDYPYHVEKYLNEENVNMFMYMGAQQSTSLARDEGLGDLVNDTMTDEQKQDLVGQVMSDRVLTAVAGSDIEVNPILNVRIENAVFKLDNAILALAGKASMFETEVVKSGFNEYSLVTEIGYVEIGNSFAWTMIPGELAPELAFGGYLPADVSWSGEDFNNTNLSEIVGEERYVLPMGLCNDQIGYIIPDNNYMSLIAEESDSLEFVSIGINTASTLLASFKALVDSVR